MSVYNYEYITYEVKGMSVINDPKDTKQEGILFHLRAKNPAVAARYGRLGEVDMYMDKRDLAHIASTIKTGRRFWKRFRLPKMIEQKAGDHRR